MTIKESILQNLSNSKTYRIRLISLCTRMIPSDKLLTFSLFQGMLFVPKLVSKSISEDFYSSNIYLQNSFLINHEKFNNVCQQ